MRVETFAREPGAEQVILLASAWLERGMTLLGAGDELPETAAGWLLWLGGDGTAVLTEPGGSTVYEGGHTEPGTWGSARRRDAQVRGPDRDGRPVCGTARVDDGRPAHRDAGSGSPCRGAGWRAGRNPARLIQPCEAEPEQAIYSFVGTIDL
jgi:hypothetical protein